MYLLQNAVLLREGSLQLWVGVSPAKQTARRQARSRQAGAPNSSSSPEPNAALLNEGTSRSPHLCFDSPAARTFLSLVVLVLLIVRSCRLCRDLTYLPFACSRRQLYLAISRCSKAVWLEYSGDNKLSLLGQKPKVFYELQVYLFSTFWFWPSPCGQLPSPDLESDQPVVQRPNRRPCRHKESTTPTTSTYQTDNPVYDQPSADNRYQTNDQPASRWLPYTMRLINLRLFSCYTVALRLRLSLHCLGCSH